MPRYYCCTAPIELQHCIAILIDSPAGCLEVINEDRRMLWCMQLIQRAPFQAQTL